MGQNKFDYPEKWALVEQPETVRLLSLLRDLAPSLILDDPRNAGLRADPDSMLEHQPEWHQWGFITHTGNVVVAFEGETQRLLEEWGLREDVDAVLSQMIGNRTKRELLIHSLPLHDIGKFRRGWKVKPDGSPGPDYNGHEAESERIIREHPAVQQVLTDELRLTPEQIDYLARCAGIHFELGLVRKAAKETPAGYSVAMTEGEAFRRCCEELAEKFPDYRREIGVLFLCDSLGKIDMRITARTDAEIAASKSDAQRMVAERGLPKSLAQAALQLPVNIAAAREYLRFIAEHYPVPREKQ